MKNTQGPSEEQGGNMVTRRTILARLVGGLLGTVVLMSAWMAEVDAAGVEGERRLAHWRFDNPDLAGDEGQKPLVATSLGMVPSFNGNAVRLVTGSNAVLQYRLVEPGGHENLNCARGAIRFFFKPDWTSVKLGGTGPGVYGRLVEVGDYVDKPPFSGLWLLTLTPDGNRILFIAQSENASGTVLSADIGWRANSWHEITFSYGPESTRLEVDAAAPTYGAGFSIVPNAAVQARGFRIGSSSDGTQNAGGAFDEVETFGMPSSPIQTWQNEGAFSAVIETSPQALHLYWRNPGTVTNTLQRREIGANEWTTLAAGLTSWDYRDATLRPGVRYEYRLLRNSTWSPFIGGCLRLYGAIDAPPVEHRGHVVLLVDETLAGGLKSELKQLLDDLAGDGWQIHRHDVARHNDQDWPANTNSIGQIQKIVASDYAAAPQDDWCLYVLGHVATPCSGFVIPDGHYHRPWPTDSYYADVSTSEKWTDIKNNGQPGDTPNTPGDGKWDQYLVPSPLKMSFGRVDFSRLIALSTKPPAGIKPVSELELTRRYLEKTHRYRTGQLVFPNMALIDAAFYRSRKDYPWFGPNIYSFLTDIMNGTRWFGGEAQTMAHADFFKANTPAILGIKSAFASPSTIDDVGPNQTSSEQLADSSRQPPVAFAVFDGSYLGQWDYENNLMRTFLASANGGLGAIWIRAAVLPMENLAMGDTIGNGVRAYLNNTNFFRAGPSIIPELQGDPALRLQITPPVEKVTARKSQDGVRLEWNTVADSDARYYVYRAAGLNEPFERIAGPIGEAGFVDAQPAREKNIYQVRVARRVVTGSGSFTNLSTGTLCRLNGK